MEREQPSRSGHTAQREDMHGDNNHSVDSGVMGGTEAYHSLAGYRGPHSDVDIRSDTADTSNALMEGALATGGGGGRQAASLHRISLHHLVIVASSCRRHSPWEFGFLRLNRSETEACQRPDSCVHFYLRG